MSSPWKPCDLRGAFPISINEDLFYRVGAAAGSRLRVGERAVVAGDFRLSTPVLKTALIEGLVAAGIHVVDAGQLPTPLAYFCKRQMDAEGLFMVTASHNPARDNGLKVMLGELPPTERELAEIRKAAEAGEFRGGAGNRETTDPAPAYREWILNRWAGLKGKEFGKVILDAGHGAWSLLAPEVFRELGFDIECLFCEPDGNFPGRASDCNRTGNLSRLRETVKEHGAELGIAWDGDGDRVAFIDAAGRHVSTDQVSILFARRTLEEARPGENVICDIKLSDAVRRAVLQLGGNPSLEKSGHAFMRSRMIHEKAILGLDACGHYFYRELGFGDDGLFAALYMIDLMRKEGPLAALAETAGPIHSTPEVRIPEQVMAYDAIAAHIRAEFHGAPETHVDGIRVELPDGIVLVRKSSTEPVVSLRIEGFTEEALQALVWRCAASLVAAADLLRRQIAAAS